MNTFIIQQDRVDENTLRALAGMIGSVMGAEISVRRQFVVGSESQVCLLALETLFGERLPQLTAPAPEKPFRHYKKRTQQLVGAPLGLGGFPEGPEPTQVIDAEEAPAKRKRGRRPKSEAAQTPLPQRVKSWRVEVPGQEIELISGQEKNRRLDAGLFEPDVILHHPKAGAYRVHGERYHQQFVKPLTGEQS